MPAEVFHLGAVPHGPADTLVGTLLPDLVVVDLEGAAKRLRDLPKPLVLEVFDGRRLPTRPGLDPMAAIAERHPAVPFHILLSQLTAPSMPATVRLVQARQTVRHLMGPTCRPVLLDDAHRTVLRCLDVRRHAVLVVGRTGQLVWRSDRDESTSLDEALDRCVAPPPPPRLVFPAQPSLVDEIVETLEHRVGVVQAVVCWLPRRLGLLS
jgi:hypothetical protein